MIEGEDEESQLDDLYGHRKMEHFKERCRNILTEGAPFEHDDVAYEGETIDIVTAYKQLKLDLSKQYNILSESNVNRKGFLKPTMAYIQSKRAKFE